MPGSTYRKVDLEPEQVIPLTLQNLVKKHGNGTCSCTCSCENGEHDGTQERKCYTEDPRVKETLEIIRRADPNNVLIKEVYITRAHPDLELLEMGPESLREFNPESAFRINFHAEAKILMAICKELWADAPVSYASAALLAQAILQSSRKEVFDIIATHPFYRDETSSYERQLRIQQELVDFFDRRFTYHVVQLTEEDFLIDRLLRIGGWGDYLFEEVDVGSYDHEEIEALNKNTWKLLSGS